MHKSRKNSVNTQMPAHSKFTQAHTHWYTTGIWGDAFTWQCGRFVATLSLSISLAAHILYYAIHCYHLKWFATANETQVLVWSWKRNRSTTQPVVRSCSNTNTNRMVAELVYNVLVQKYIILHKRCFHPFCTRVLCECNLLLHHCK